MQEKVALFKTLGMNRDLSESSFKSEFAFENKNIRFSTLENNTLMSLVNEKGTLQLETSINGTPIGYAVIDNKIVLFTTYTIGLENKDNIYLIDIIDDIVDALLMYTEDLDFDVQHPLETLPIYENQNAIKVYWVDGKNQPRVINIAPFYKDKDCFLRNKNTLFDFLATMELKESCTIEKDSLAAGFFTPGTILYVFTYFNKYGQESNIFHTSSLYYISYKDRGAASDDIVSNAFNIHLENLDNNFKWVRIYSIHRTNQDAVPTVKNVVDLEILNTKKQYNTVETFNSAELYFPKEDNAYDTFSTEQYQDKQIGWLWGTSSIRLKAIEGEDEYGKYIQYPLDIEEAGGGKSPFVRFKGQTYFADSTQSPVSWFIRVYSDTPYSNDYTGILIGNTASNKLFYSILNTENTRSITYVDDGESGAVVDPTILLYVGGKQLIASTLALKDNTLFLGNIEAVGELIDDSIKTAVKGLTLNILFVNNKLLEEKVTSGIYPYTNHLNKSLSQISTFKYGETYRFGLLLQRATGEWSEPIWIGDRENDKKINDGRKDVPNPVNLLTTALLDISSIKDKLKDYKRIRPLIVYPSYTDRTVICQGVLNPTVFNVLDRSTNSPYAQSSWFFRPNPNTLLGTNVNMDYSTAESRYFIILATTVKPIMSATTITIFKENSFENDKYSVLPYGFLQSTLANHTVYLGLYVLSGRGRHSPEDVLNELQSLTSLEGAVLGGYKGTIYNEDSIKIVGCSILYISSVLPSGDVPYIVSTDPTLISCLSILNIAVPLINKGITWTATITTYATTEIIDVKGDALIAGHFRPLPSNTSRSCEIQCNVDIPSSPYLGDKNKNDYMQDYSDVFFVDLSILSFHSPDIEFDNNLKGLNEEGLLLKIVGYVPITGTVGDLDLQTSTPVLNIRNRNVKSTPLGFYKEGVGELNISAFGYLGLVTTNAWIDEIYTEHKNDDDYYYNTEGKVRGFPVYPWHRSGSLNNLSRDSTDPKVKEVDSTPSNYRSAKLTKKKMSNLRFSFKSVYINNDEEYDISGLLIFNSDLLTNTRLSSPTGDAINYYGNIDKVLVNMKARHEYRNLSHEKYLNLGFVENQFNYNGYTLSATKPFKSSELHNIFKSNLQPLKITSVNDVLNLSDIISTDPISMKYKSSPHGVLSLKADKGSGSSTLNILPNMNNLNATPEVGGIPFWNDDTLSINQRTINESSIYGWLWLADLVRTNVANRFGGNTDNAIENNSWALCGDSLDLDSNDTILKWTEGDTYFLRYDCLKTYPFTNDDVNSVVDILSFMCETRINIDGRYDRNRGLASNLTMSPVNFNLLNYVYSQRNNFFNYRILDNDMFNFNKYPYTVAWSKTKFNGEKVDTWTSINMGSSIDLDGNLGEITALRKFNDGLIAFLTKGISQILYNELTQISTESGVPVEIANSGKVTGKRYISSSVGCLNKWSICETSNGVYFVDDYNKVIYLLSDKLNPLSDIQGFHSWMSTNCNTKVWNPKDFENLVTYYDLTNQDVLFVAKDWCLAFSEGLGRFTSFYDYNGVPYFINFKGNGYWFKEFGQAIPTDYDYSQDVANTIIKNPNKWTTQDICIKFNIGALKLPRLHFDDVCYINLEEAANSFAYTLAPVLNFDTARCGIWKHNAGDYNNFFGETKGYSTTIIVNLDYPLDKTYSTVEFRADSFINDECLHFMPPFDTIEAWNEYQRGIINLNNKELHQDLRKKFRVWRADIPRNNTSLTNKRDRMRNPWIYLKLSKEKPSVEKTVLHDLIVHYYV